MQKYFFSVIFICHGIFAYTQVAVRNEPRHHNVFENEYVRILDVHLGPGDTTLYHTHNTPSVFISFTRSITGSQLLGQSPVKGTASVPGRPSYDNLSTPRIHRVWNEDSTWFHVMDIELTGEKPLHNEPALQSPLFKLAFNEPMANGYNVQIQQGESLQLPVSESGFLLISNGDAEINYNQLLKMKAGHYIWIEKGKTATITVIGNKVANFTLLQLK